MCLDLRIQVRLSRCGVWHVVCVCFETMRGRRVARKMWLFSDTGLATAFCQARPRLHKLTQAHVCNGINVQGLVRPQ